MPKSSVSLYAAALAILALTVKSQYAFAQVPSPLQIDQTQYHARCIKGKGQACTYGFRLIARYENRTADSLYVDRCGPGDRTPQYGVESAADTTQEAAYDPVWACVGHDYPIVIAPHTTRVDTLRLEGPNSFGGKTNAPLGAVEGVFRLIYNVGTCWLGRAGCRLLPQEQRSQKFRVDLVR